MPSSRSLRGIDLLHVCYGNQLEVLAGQLAEDLESPLTGPLEPELIAVQGHAVSRWLSLRLATERGISANNQMLFPAELLWQLFRRVLPDEVPSINGFSAETLSWRVLALLQTAPFVRRHPLLTRYLETASPVLQWQLAQRLGRQFEQYLIYRPDWIHQWESGDENHWQGALWRQLVAAGDDRHWLSLQGRLLSELHRVPKAIDRLPTRISLFALPRLSRVYLELLQAVAVYCDVRIYALNFSEVFWADIVSNKERARIELAAGDGLLTYLETGNSLLASMGRQGREYFGQLVELDAFDSNVFSPPTSGTLLGNIQSDIFHLREGRDGGERYSVEPDDDSIQLHICHSPMREVEVLHDRLLDHFHRDASLDPADVLVLVPEIEAYAPYIEAVFGAATGNRRLPYRIADLGVLQQSSVVESFLALLDLPKSRFDANAVIAPLAEPAVRRRYGLSDSDIDQIHRWVRDAGIRWGVDAEDMTTLELPVGEENTWRRGTDRLILGYALPEGDLFRGLAPCGPSDSSDAQIVGRLRTYLEQVFQLRNRLSGERSVEDWTARLNSLLDCFFTVDPGNENELRALRDALTATARSAEDGGYRGEVTLEVYRQDLAQRLAAPGRGLFMTGAVTFAALAPGRCLPSRLVCLLGLNDGVFPRSDSRQGFDLIAQSPRDGDRRQRDEDRQVFLDAVLCVRQRLYISYTGRDIRDDSPKPPSALVSELLDYVNRISAPLGEGQAAAAITIEHPMQAFSRRYFDRSSRILFSYAREFVRSGNVRAPGPSALLSGPLPQTEAGTGVTLENLVQFFNHPARALLRDVLDVRLESHDAMLQTREPTGLDYYTTVAVRELMLTGKQQGDTFAAIAARLRAAGHLPVATPGTRVLESEWRRIQPLFERLSSAQTGGEGEVLELALDIAGTRLLGRVRPVTAGGLVHYSVMDLGARDRLRLWLSHLALGAAGPLSFSNSQLLGSHRAEIFTPVVQPQALLADLIELYQEGLTRPLPFFPRSAWEYASAGGDSMKAAVKTWASTEFSWGEGEDAYYQLAFRDSGIDVLEGEFEQLASRIFGPLREHLVEVA